MWSRQFGVDLLEHRVERVRVGIFGIEVVAAGAVVNDFRWLHLSLGLELVEEAAKPRLYPPIRIRAATRRRRRTFKRSSSTRTAPVARAPISAATSS
jgi:hypothetical protein